MPHRQTGERKLCGGGNLAVFAGVDIVIIVATVGEYRLLRCQHQGSTEHIGHSGHDERGVHPSGSSR